jgi:hypothetical protein
VVDLATFVAEVVLKHLLQGVFCCRNGPYLFCLSLVSFYG